MFNEDILLVVMFVFILFCYLFFEIVILLFLDSFVVIIILESVVNVNCGIIVFFVVRVMDMGKLFIGSLIIVVGILLLEFVFWVNIIKKLFLGVFM